jgi:hypothetical protein
VVRPVGQYAESTKGTLQMTMETNAAWKARSNKLRRGFAGGSHAPIIIAADEGASDNDARRDLHWEEKGRRADPHNPRQNLDQHWYSVIVIGLPLLWHVVAVCYWSIVILLGWYPWNILLMLLSPPAMDSSRHDQTALCREGCPTDVGAHDER